LENEDGEMTIESVTREALQSAFAPGTALRLSRPQRGAVRPQPAVVFGWGRDAACDLTLALGVHDPVPQEGERVKLEATRLDGLFQVAGTLHGVAPVDPAASRMVRARLRPDIATATRLQRRAFFRLPGRWPARIHAASPTPDCEIDATGLEITVHDLSAGGMLFAQPEGAPLGIGTRLRVTLDLGDEAVPLAAMARIVRRQASPIPDGPVLWGCQFCDLAQEGEWRILRRLHTLYRARSRGAGRAPKLQAQAA
jgi:hypothetical protein